MLTGSMASSFYGRPRSTHDADVVIDPTSAQVHSDSSERQLADVAGIVEVTLALDRSYIDHWAVVLGVDDLWRGLSPP